jgi:hypothetical protein
LGTFGWWRRSIDGQINDDAIGWRSDSMLARVAFAR